VFENKNKDIFFFVTYYPIVARCRQVFQQQFPTQWTHVLLLLVIRKAARGCIGDAIQRARIDPLSHSVEINGRR
jgi:hypothetical protein